MKAKAWETRGSEVLFGNVNLVVLGDLGQLKPVKAKSFFSHELVSKIPQNTAMSIDGQTSLMGAYIWHSIQNVIILRKNWRAQHDPKFINLLARVREGLAWDARTPMTPKQRGTGPNYGVSDYETLRSREYHMLDAAEKANFRDAPVIVATKVVRDVINLRMARDFAHSAGQILRTYKSIDRFKRQRVPDEMQKRLWKVRSKLTKDSLGELPLVIGMKVTITENIAIKASVVNGATGIVREIKYAEDQEGNRFLKCVYISIEGTDVRAHGIDSEWIPIFPVSTSFEYRSIEGAKYTITRSQVPLLPAYAFVDYKVQGRSMTKANIDLRDCRSLQSLYVMPSRATPSRSLRTPRPLPPQKTYKRTAQELRDEFERLEHLHRSTALRRTTRDNNTAQQY
jgi:ATP-dependent DNA helicase PIF1